MSDVDDLVAAMVKGDPGETVPLDIVTAMAEAALRAHWIPCPHTDWITEYTIAYTNPRRTCQRCGARLVVEPDSADG
jgi:uncharacterized paraquat-inducible protein A